MGFAGYRAEDGWAFLTGPGGGGAAHQWNDPGFDGVAFKTSGPFETHIIDNKSWARAGEVGSATALRKNLESNLSDLIQVAADPAFNDVPNIDLLRSSLASTLTAVQAEAPIPNEVKLVITNFGGRSTGVTPGLAAEGITFRDLTSPPPGPSISSGPAPAANAPATTPAPGQAQGETSPAPGTAPAPATETAPEVPKAGPAAEPSPVAGEAGFITVEVAGTIASIAVSILLGQLLAKLQQSLIEDSVKKLEPNIHSLLQAHSRELLEIQLQSGPSTPALVANVQITYSFSQLMGADPISGIPLQNETFLGSKLEGLTVGKDPVSLESEEDGDWVFAGDGISTRSKKVHSTFPLPLKPFSPGTLLAEIDDRIGKLDRQEQANPSDSLFNERQRLLDLRKQIAGP
ncbi:MAG: hypothetical protein ACLQGP_22445 [Isosphaeraceae bacterium]